MKKLLLPLALIIAASAAAETTADTTFVFTNVISIPCTSVKDQNKSGTCWCFAVTAFFENELLRLKGREYDLSEMYTVRHCYLDKADKYVRMNGKTNFAPGGELGDVAYVWRRHGVVPESAYPGINYGEEKHVHGELDNVLSAYVDAVGQGRKKTPVWHEGFERVLDTYLGEVPETFEFEGKTYTPQSFAESLGLNFDDYVMLTSFTHHPFYEEFVLEIPDNWLWDKYYNVPLNELKAAVDEALGMGYSVAWAADISEEGFKWNDGVALMPAGKDEKDMDGTELSRWVKLSDKDRLAEKYNFSGPVPEIEVTQEVRQKMFDAQETTDDHAMLIVGTATDQCGNRYYKVKNSWDTNQIYDGYIYVSEPYFLAKTLSVYFHK